MQYQTAEASCFVEQAFSVDLTPSDIQAAGRDLFRFCKDQVFTELGIDMRQDEDTGVIFEVFGPGVAHAAPQALEASSEPVSPASPPKRSAPPRKASTPKARATPARKEEKTDLAEADLWDELISNPELWEDLRETKRNPKGPDFRSTVHMQTFNGRESGIGLWLHRPDGSLNPIIEDRLEDEQFPESGFANE